MQQVAHQQTKQLTPSPKQQQATAMADPDVMKQPAQRCSNILTNNQRLKAQMTPASMVQDAHCIRNILNCADNLASSCRRYKYSVILQYTLWWIC